MLIITPLVAPLLHDGIPDNPAAISAYNFETAIFCCGGFVAGGVGLAGSLLLKRNIKLSRIFLICSVGVCVVFSLYGYFLVVSVELLLTLLAHSAALTLSLIMSFLREKPNNNDSQVAFVETKAPGK